MLTARPLRTATFRHLAAAYWINEFGNVVADVALAILVFNRTGSAWATATLFVALRFAPALVAPFLTSFVQGIPARRVLPALYLLEALIFGVIALASEHFTLGGVLALAAIDGVLGIAARALTRSANANHLIALGELRTGNGLLNLGSMGANAVGPALGGAIVAAGGASLALVVDAASFATASMLLATAPKLHIESDLTTSTRGRLRAAAREIRSDPLVSRVFLAGGAALLLGSIPIPIEVIFAKSTLHAGDQGYGLLLTSWGIGMVLGGALFTSLNRVRVTLLLAGSALLISAAYAGLALSPTLAVACACSVVGGLGNGISGVAAITAVQSAIGMTAQGSVMAALESVIQLMPGIGFVLGGAIAALSSPRVAYAAAAGGILFVLLLAALPFGRSQRTATRLQVPHPDAEPEPRPIGLRG